MNRYDHEYIGKDCKLYVSPEHTFGTDAFLLADFAEARRKDKVCDLGTGCGIIAVLIKKLYSSREIYGVDIQEQAIEQFTMTVEDSRLDNVTPLLMDIKALHEPLLNNSFDLVTCNPPYKAANAGIESLNEAQRIARHEILCNIEDICAGAYKLLKTGGRLCMCNRPERLADVVCAMRNSGIEPKRLRFVSGSADTAPWLFLIDGTKGGKSFMKVLPQIYMDKGGISDRLKELWSQSIQTEGGL